MTALTTFVTPARATWRACAAAMLVALASAACDRSGTLTAPSPHAASPAPPLRITDFSADRFVEGSTFVYRPMMSLTASAAGAVTVTDLWIELQRGYEDRGSYFPSRFVQYRIQAGATLRLFESGRISLESDFDADRMWVHVSYVDDGGGSGTVQATTAVTR